MKRKVEMELFFTFEREQSETFHFWFISSQEFLCQINFFITAIATVIIVVVAVRTFLMRLRLCAYCTNVPRNQFLPYPIPVPYSNRSSNGLGRAGAVSTPHSEP